MQLHLELVSRRNFMNRGDRSAEHCSSAREWLGEFSVLCEQLVRRKDRSHSSVLIGLATSIAVRPRSERDVVPVREKLTETPQRWCNNFGAQLFCECDACALQPTISVIRAETDPQAIECLVPPLLLQPLVENAVVHGVAQLVEGGTIAMAARRTGSTVTITLENPCDPDRSRTRGVGLGLALLRNRLTAQFGAYDAVHAAEDAGRFRVEVRIPAVTTA